MHIRDQRRLIPMDASTSPSTPRGPMTRARSKAIEDKVNSLLSEIPLSTQETWLLPQTETLCVIRYNAEEEASGVNSLLSPEPARNFLPPELPACPELPASFDIDYPGHSNFLLSPEPARNLARNFRPPEPSALPGTSGPRKPALLHPCQLSA